jgi:hypothetical protein
MWQCKRKKLINKSPRKGSKGFDLCVIDTTFGLIGSTSPSA